MGVDTYLRIIFYLTLLPRVGGAMISLERLMLEPSNVVHR